MNPKEPLPPLQETMPYARIAAEWVPLREKGWDLILEFTCTTCGAASLHSRPNELPPLATCEVCGATVDVEANGGWFGIVRPMESDASERAAEEAAEERRRELAEHPVDAVADLTATFRHYRLPLWPIPVRFAPDLRKADAWLWTTRAIDPMEMYLFRRYPVEATYPGVADYLAISHAGHGVNSYALNYHLVRGPLALFVQVSWGGVYADDDWARAELARQSELIRELIPLAEKAATHWDGKRRLIVAESTFRWVDVCKGVDLRGRTLPDTDRPEDLPENRRVRPPRLRDRDDRAPRALEKAIKELRKRA